MADFKDAGKEYGSKVLAESPTLPTKYYPSFEIDLDKFSELSADIGETITFLVKAEVKSKRLDESGKCQYVDVKMIAVPDKPKGNEADEALAALKGKY